jgi:hypothetical protein
VIGQQCLNAEILSPCRVFDRIPVTLRERVANVPQAALAGGLVEHHHLEGLALLLGKATLVDLSDQVMLARLGHICTLRALPGNRQIEKRAPAKSRNPTHEAAQKRAASVVLVERPEGNQWILLAPWGRRYLGAWRAYERSEDKKPLLTDFRPKISRGGGAATSTQQAARPPSVAQRHSQGLRTSVAQPVRATNLLRR